MVVKACHKWNIEDDFKLSVTFAVSTHGAYRVIGGSTNGMRRRYGHRKADLPKNMQDVWTLGN
ncbi:hypothetical protein Pta6605_34530 [Pseudomonas amygdali pv. tabaci]|nr:hypothetical protein Pta6605_34530 [Pseudomonas amygdali pv. tabaci]